MPQFSVPLLILAFLHAALPTLQLSNGALQVNPQVPPEQVDVEFAGGVQTAPHPPQWLVSLLVLVSQPSAPLPLQLSKGALQVNPQVPPEQVDVELVGGVQTVPH